MTTNRLLCFLVLLLLPIACSTKSKNKPEKKDNRTGQARLIGTVEMVNPEQGYVLILCDHRPTLREGTELIALDDKGQKSKLVVTPERKGNYLTADIKEGDPATGCLVLQKILESDQLPAAAPKPSDPNANAVDNTTSETLTMPTERPPPIPEVIFPSQGGTAAPTSTPETSSQPPPLPLEPPALEKAAPAPDLSKLPPIIR